MALFGIKSKAEKERERKKKVMETVTRQNQPPRTVDKAWRPLDPKRTPYGYRGYDPKKEPMVDIDTRQRASQILRERGVTPAEVKKKVAAARTKRKAK